MLVGLRQGLAGRVWTFVGLGLVALSLAALSASGQIIYSSGQNIAPVFEGWEENSDGTFTLVFGYFNRNVDEIVDIPIGAANGFEPGLADRGQPTRFFPRRNYYVFTVTVPNDFGSQELVWALTAHGKTERAYGTLKPEYIINNQIRMITFGGIGGRGGEQAGNQPPVVRIEGEGMRRVKVGEPLSLVAHASDDGIPKPRVLKSLPSTSGYLGLRVGWFVYRGAAHVTFTPQQFKVYPDYRSDSPWTPGWAPPPPPADGRFLVTVTFDRPGDFVIRVMANDGGLAATRDVSVTVVDR